MTTIVGSPISVAAGSLFDLTLRTARSLNIVEEGNATGGSTTTISDTNDRGEDDTYWDGGTLWLIENDDSPGAVPAGEYSVVQSFTNSTATALLRGSLSAAIESGDKYAIATNEVPLNVIIQQINQVLREQHVAMQDTSLTFSSEQAEYTISSSTSKGLREVWMQYWQDAGTDRWTMLYNWRVEHNTAGSGDILILPGSAMQMNGYSLKLIYVDRHAELHESDDILHESIDPDLIIAGAVLGCLRWLRRRTRSKEYDIEITEAAEVYNRRMAERSILPRKTGKIGAFSWDRNKYPGDKDALL